jgi:hypothetical protein
MGRIQKLMVLAGVGALYVLEGTSMALAQAATPKYTNAEVVTIKAQERLLVIRTNEGTEQTLELDDQLVGFGDLRPGDRVILTLRGEPGRARIEAFSKAAPPAPRAQKTETSISAVETNAEVRSEEAYDQRVATLAQQANRVDNLWNGFKTSCNVTLREGNYEGAREWLSLWDGQAQVDLSSGSCRDLFNQIIGLGEAVNSGMVAAENSARQNLEPGQIRDIQRRHSLDWAGWGRNPPELRDPK